MEASRHNKNGALVERRFEMGDAVDGRLFAITTDSFDRATGEGLLAEILLVVVLRLLEDVGMSTVIIAVEVGRSGLTSEITVDALIVHVVGTRDVVGIFVCGVGHCVLLRFGGATVEPRGGCAMTFLAS